MWYQFALILASALAFWQARQYNRAAGAWERVIAFVRQPLNRAALVLLANCIIVTSAFYVTKHNDNLVLSAIVDGLSAWLIMRDPAGREQGWLGLTFAFQIGCHAAAYAMVQEGIAFAFLESTYFSLINYAFLVQIGVLAAWSEDHGGKLGSIIERGFGHVFHRVKGVEAY